MTARFHGALIGLGVVGVAALFFFAVFIGGPRALHSAKLQSGQLPSWSSAKIRAQMGEANQVVDGSALGFPAGTTCRIWFSQARAFILCTA